MRRDLVALTEYYNDLVLFYYLHHFTSLSLLYLNAIVFAFNLVVKRDELDALPHTQGKLNSSRNVNNETLIDASPYAQTHRSVYLGDKHMTGDLRQTLQGDKREIIDVGIWSVVGWCFLDLCFNLENEDGRCLPIKN